MSTLLGIDVGGTGIKGALVNTKTGELLSDKIKYKTPQPAVPANIPEVMMKLIKDFDWVGKPIGCGFPAVIKNGVSYTATNIEKEFINYDINKNFGKKLGCQVFSLNDADAAGMAEVQFGHGKGIKGSLLLLTLGTGIGSGFFINGQLVPNVELGHLRYRDSILEKHASNKARKSKKMDWEEFGNQLNLAIQYINKIVNPQTIIISGGVSKSFDNYAEYIKVDAKVLQAKFLNNAGLIGAACFAQNELGS